MGQLRTMLRGRRSAFLLEPGFDGSNFSELRSCLAGAGANIVVVAPAQGVLLDRNESIQAEADISFSNSSLSDFEVLVLGDDWSAKEAKLDQDACRLVDAAIKAGKPVVAIGRGVEMLICAGALKGRKATGLPAMKAEIERAGAMYKERAVVIDRNLITAKSARYIGDVCECLVDLFRGRPPRAA